MENKIIVCKRCGCKLRLPANKGVLAVTCPKCKYKFQFDSGPKSMNTGTNPPYSKPIYKAAASNRTVTIYRSTHTYKEWNATGLLNMLKDHIPVHIFVDDKDQGVLAKEGSLTIHIDGSSHALKCSVLGAKYLIPAGTEHYEANFFNNSLKIGPVHDPFRDGLTAFVLKIFRSQGIRERMADLNNQYHNVAIHVSQDGIRLSWRLAQTRGLKQWATGTEEEKISYYQAGLTPLPKEKQPGGYWDYIQMWI